mmetsp:Transcript_63063/g.133117  ORF Transcript_63063/g.133117 Transcript_63063/m.133117 type:complete len:578 (+) Transcript_63063:90-1823(+)|eukprot:CAMPEP_0206430844 /NCGR_PEP_ID=MMETSP0324_2-20121206/7039_1 /ASSEMBLY_ACC=CAM_ASM_000836 /TAXON_ID=2866 /ORGANISM="Crypthecodinium cohnii, Strain Seligo" /LENGTH=577 /DNA_ID=CAMNT_0053896715 /DNA_START=36 /DNA_END=1769 /DNA_ORIENTATION=+
MMVRQASVEPRFGHDIHDLWEPRTPNRVPFKGREAYQSSPLAALKRTPPTTLPSSSTRSPWRTPTREYCDRLVPSRAASDLGTGLAVLDAAFPDGGSSSSTSKANRTAAGFTAGIPPAAAAASATSAAAIAAAAAEASSGGLRGSPRVPEHSGHSGLPPSTPWSPQALRSPDDENSGATYDRLLRGELLGHQSSPSVGQSDCIHRTPERRIALFKYATIPAMPHENDVRAFSTPWKAEPCEEVPSKPSRHIVRDPYRILDAPGMPDDFYQSCLDNSSDDVLAVALGDAVDTFNIRTNRYARLCATDHYGCTALKWSDDGRILAVGKQNGEVQIWDWQARRLQSTLQGHLRRAGALSWNKNTIATGSRDKSILLHDVRARPSAAVLRFGEHEEEICGLKWSPDGEQLASGGNEGDVCIWDSRFNEQPLYRFDHHSAAVRALAWSPHQRGVLVTGGGTACKTIRYWSTLLGEMQSCTHTGSQVCNLHWSQNCDEVVSTHGYSANEINIWKPRTMTRVGSLLGHTARVLHITPLADGKGIITGAGDEAIRFWDVFPAKSVKRGAGLDDRIGPSSLLRTIR